MSPEQWKRIADFEQLPSGWQHGYCETATPIVIAAALLWLRFSKTAKKPVTKDDDIGIMRFSLRINQVIGVVGPNRLAKGHVKLAAGDFIPDIKSWHDRKPQPVDGGVDDHLMMGKARSLDAAAV